MGYSYSERKTSGNDKKQAIYKSFRTGKVYNCDSDDRAAKRRLEKQIKDDDRAYEEAESKRKSTTDTRTQAERIRDSGSVVSNTDLQGRTQVETYTLIRDRLQRELDRTMYDPEKTSKLQRRLTLAEDMLAHAKVKEVNTQVKELLSQHPDAILARHESDIMLESWLVNPHIDQNILDGLKTVREKLYSDSDFNFWKEQKSKLIAAKNTMARHAVEDLEKTKQEIEKQQAEIFQE